MKSKLLRFSSAAILISFATSLAYMNSLDGPFVFDDVHNIKENHRIKIDDLSIDSLKQAMTDNPTPRPIAYLSFAINYFFSGEHVRGYHITNIVIHAINGILVYLLSLTILAAIYEESAGENHFWIALAVGLLFVLHPIQTQSVDYIVQRMTSLSALFYFSAVFCWLKCRTSQRPMRIGVLLGSTIFFWLLALGTKQFAATLPAAILLLEWIIFQKGKWNKSYLLIVAGALFLIAIVCFAFKGTDFFKLFTRGYAQREFTLAERLLTESRVVMHYLSLLIWPSPGRLTLIYDFPLSISMFQPISTMFSWLAILISIGLSIVYARRYPLIALSTLWFFLHLVVESTVIPLEIIYEHRLYLPLFGFALIFAKSIFDSLNKYNLFMVVCLCICCWYGYWTYERNQVWESKLSLWTDNVAKQPTEPRGLASLANEKAAIGLHDEALQLINRAIESEPNFQAAFVRRGLIQESQNRPALALKDYNHAIAIPQEKRRGIVYDEAFTARGDLYRKAGRFDLAEKDLDAALEFNPHHTRAYLARADLFSVTNRPAQAVSDYNQALRLYPDSINANKNLSWLLATTDDEMVANSSEAIRFALRSCELSDWKDHSALSTLAAAYARALRFDDAVKAQKQAIELAPVNQHNALNARIKHFQDRKPIIITRTPNPAEKN